MTMEKEVSSYYQIIKVIGSRPESWEKAAAAAVEQASADWQVAACDGVDLAMHIANGKIGSYVAKVTLSCKAVK